MPLLRPLLLAMLLSLV